MTLGKRRTQAAHYSAVELLQWTDALRPDKYAALFAGREFFVAEEDGPILGFGVLDVSQSLINATYVSPRTVRRGVGRTERGQPLAIPLPSGYTPNSASSLHR